MCEVCSNNEFSNTQTPELGRQLIQSQAALNEYKANQGKGFALYEGRMSSREWGFWLAGPSQEEGELSHIIQFLASKSSFCYVASLSLGGMSKVMERPGMLL